MVNVGTAGMSFCFISCIVPSLSCVAWSMDATPASTANRAAGSPWQCTPTLVFSRAASATAAWSCASVYW